MNMQIMDSNPKAFISFSCPQCNMLHACRFRKHTQKAAQTEIHSSQVSVRGKISCQPRHWTLSSKRNQTLNERDRRHAALTVVTLRRASACIVQVCQLPFIFTVSIRSPEWACLWRKPALFSPVLLLINIKLLMWNVLSCNRAIIVR